MESSIDKDNVTNKLIENNEKKQKLEEQLRALRSTQRTRKPVSYESAKELAAMLGEADSNGKRRILREIIEKIVFFKNKTIKIEFNI